MHTDPDERQGGRALTGPYAASDRSCVRWPICQPTDIEHRQHVGVVICRYEPYRGHISAVIGGDECRHSRQRQ